MIFNSFDFAIFLPIVFILYWFATNRNLTLQNALIVFSSFLFYGWWDWRFLFLMIGTASIDFIVGILLISPKYSQKRKLLLMISIFANLGILVFFKYFNFFIDSFISSFTLLGYSFKATSLNIVLPVGISFYTFQALSYTIDVYRKKLEPTKNIIDYFAFISFFPQLVAGPIERATNLLPQFYKKRDFNYENAVDGSRQILWGLFKKIVIADNCAIFANQIFNHYHDYTSYTLLLGAIFFAFQIYADFSGYSDIAIGTAKLFGFSIMRNFNYPYFSRDIAEFWRRWHISLSTWFRDYVYVPLGGSKVKDLLKARNIFIVFLVSGFWHGANWTFIAWGFLNACFFLPLLLLNKNRSHIGDIAHNKLLPSVKEFTQIGSTFLLTLIAWVFFRSNSINDALQYNYNMFIELTSKQAMLDAFNFIYWQNAFYIIVLLVIFIATEWVNRNHEHVLKFYHPKFKKKYRWMIYLVIIFTIAWLGVSEQSFIYFQF